MSEKIKQALDIMKVACYATGMNIYDDDSMNHINAEEIKSQEAYILKEFGTLEAENANLKASMKIMVCSFCGHITERTDDHNENCLKMAEHMMSCVNHPLRLMLEEKEQENAALKKQVEDIRKDTANRQQIEFLKKLQPKIKECMGFLMPFDKFIFNGEEYTFRFLNFGKWYCSDKLGMSIEFTNLTIDDILHIPLAIDPINPERGLWGMIDWNEWDSQVLQGGLLYIKQSDKVIGGWMNDPYTAMLKALCEQEGTGRNCKKLSGNL